MKTKFFLLTIITLFTFNVGTAQTDNITIGVFGGSLSSARESEAGKKIWREMLPDTQIATHGIGGAGFTNTTNNPIYDQIANAPAYDVYILWASTNDVHRATVGDAKSTDLSTQSGGIRKCVNRIKKKNKNARILFFTSLPAFNDFAGKIPPFTKGQIEMCKKLKLKCLDQSSLLTNSDSYFLPDKLHLLENGYQAIAPVQAKFIKANLPKRSSLKKQNADTTK